MLKKSVGVFADGWAGDRAVLYRATTAQGATTAPGGRSAPAEGTPLAAAWHIRFDRRTKDPDSEAREAFKLLVQAIRPGDSTSVTVCVQRTTLGPLTLARAGRDIVLVAGPYRRAGNRVESDSVCRKSLRWAADILAKH